jgi:hypothetical protein
VNVSIGELLDGLGRYYWSGSGIQGIDELIEVRCDVAYSPFFPFIDSRPRSFPNLPFSSYHQ